MVTVSSAFISSRRERIIFSVLSASGCAFKAAALVDVLRAGLGKTDLDNTDVARDHFLSLYRGRPNPSDARHHSMHVGLMVSISSTPVRRFRRSSVLLRPSRHEPRKMSAAGNSMLRAVAQEILQLPSWFRKPVDDRCDFMPVRNVHAGVLCSARLAA